MEQLVELGSQGNMGSDYMDLLCDLSASAYAPEMAGKAYGVAVHRGIYSGDIYLCRGESAFTRAAFLCNPGMMDQTRQKNLGETAHMQNAHKKGEAIC